MKKRKLESVSAKATIFIFTRSYVYSSDVDVEPDPPMTSLGLGKIRSLKSFLPPLPPNQKFKVICGVGRRHKEIAKALNLEVTNYNPTLGIADYPTKINGKDVVVMADGTQISSGQYSQVDQNQAAIALINAIDTDTIICCGCSFLNNLGVIDGKYGSLYEITGSKIRMLS
ncbi:MAG: hypothetical protein Q8P20_04165 [bacterium]|nr:hypothetical protein [bacterium]